MIVVTPATSRVKICLGSNAMLVFWCQQIDSLDLDHGIDVTGACAGWVRSDAMAHDDTGRDAEWDTLHMELMDTLAVSELPDTSMTCATHSLDQYDAWGG